jgi:hypothetical protein
MTMTRTRRWARRLFLSSLVGTLVVAGLGGTVARANPPSISGWATNFDVPNGTDKDCEGFEVEIEDITDTQVTYTWPGTPGYPNPYGSGHVTNTTFPDGHSGVVVRMAATYGNGAWSAHTPIGQVNHYGVHVNGTPGVQRYTWLCDLGGYGAGSTGTLVPYGGTTQGNYFAQPSVPAVVPSVQPTPTGPQVVPQVVPAQRPEPAEARLPDAVWVLKYQASSPNAVDVNNLLVTDPEIQNAVNHSQIGSVAELFQPEPGANDGVETEPGDPVNSGDRSTVTVTETYHYTGPVDPADNSVTCTDVAGDPNNCSNFVGSLIARQMQSTQLSNTTPRTAVNASLYVGTIATPGAGNVTSGDLPGNADPANMDCGADGGSCFVDVDTGTAVTLTAAPTDAYDFSKWTGACTGTNPVCHVSATAVKTTKAMFVAAPKLTVGISKHGNVTSSPVGIDCSRVVGITALQGTCKLPFHRGTVVTLTATPAPGKTFVRWSGACLGVTGPVCTVTMSASKSAGAVFSG